MTLEYLDAPRVHPNAREFRYAGGSSGVLITHGLSGSLYHYRPLASSVAEAGYTVHGLRLPGHGTHPDDLQSVTAQTFREGVDAAIDRLLETCETISLLGGSFGGNLFLDAAARHPQRERIRRVIVLDPPVIVPRAWMYQPFLGIIKRFFRYYNKPWAKDDPIDGPLFTQHGSYRFMPFSVVQEFHGFIERCTKKTLAGVAQPVLILQSTHDGVVEPRGARLLARLLKNAHAELRWIDSNTHIPLLDLPVPVRRMIVSFLSKDLY